MTVRPILLAVLALILPLLAPDDAAAQQACSPAKAMGRVSVRNAIQQWQVVNRAWIEPSFALNMAIDFCDASVRLIREERATQSDIDRVAAGTIEDFLRPYLREEPGRTMSSALRARLGVSGLFRPFPRRKGTILFRYLRRVDSITVAGTSMSPVERVIISPGPTRYSGILSGRTVCGGAVAVVAAQTVHVSC